MRASTALQGINYLGEQSDNMGLSLALGGQEGANLALGIKMPNGTTAGEWVNNAPYITQNVIPFLMEAPRAFSLFPDEDFLVKTLKELIEVRSTTISGITIETKVERTDVAIGRSEQVHSEVAKVTGTRISPVHEIREVLGMPVTGFFTFYIQYLLGDKDMGFPLVTQFDKYVDAEYTPDMKTFTVLYVLPDLAHKRAQRAILQTNMMPDTSGSFEIKKDLQASGETVTYSYDFGGISQDNESTRKQGTEMLKNLLSINVNPDNIPAFQPEVAANVSDVEGGYNRVSNPPV